MITDNLLVGAKTQRFVECIRDLDKQYSLVYEALSALYGDNMAEQVMSKKYDTVYNELRNVTSNFLLDSININIVKNDFKEI